MTGMGEYIPNAWMGLFWVTLAAAVLAYVLWTLEW